jgi:hypothetical protein
MYVTSARSRTVARIRPQFEIYRQIYDDCIATDRALLDDFERHDVLAGVRAVYSVGPGFGPLEVELMRRGIVLGYAEPYERFADELEQRAVDAGVVDRIVERHRGTFDTASVHGRYDLVLAAHSWQSYVRQRAPLDRALALCTGGHMMIVTQNFESPLHRAFDARRAPELDVPQVCSWLEGQGVPHEVRQLRTIVRREVLLDDEAHLTEAAYGLATFLTTRDRDDLGDRYLEQLRATIDSHPSGIEHVRSLIVIPASASRRGHGHRRD